MISVARMFSSWCAKAVWYYRGDSVTGYVALTIDDAPGRGEPLTEEIISLLEEFDAKCTFFVVSNYMDRHEDFLEECVGKGHELANHGGDDMFALFPCPCYVPGADLACGADSPYHRHSETEFREVLLDCQRKIDTVNGTIPGVAKRRVGAPKWFRPPQGAANCSWSRVLCMCGMLMVNGSAVGKMSAAMDRVLQSFGYSIAMCDCWGMDVLCGADFVQKYTLRHVRVSIRLSMRSMIPEADSAVDGWSRTVRSCLCTCQSKARQHPSLARLCVQTAPSDLRL